METEVKDLDNKQTIVVIHEEPKSSSNPLATTGMILAIVALFIGWLPIIGQITWLLGVIFSIIGLFSKPRTKGWIGLAFSFASLILIIVLISLLGLSALVR